MDYLQRWSRLFWLDRTETDLSIWLSNEISEIYGIMESRNLRLLNQLVRELLDFFQNWYPDLNACEKSAWFMGGLSAVSS